LCGFGDFVLDGGPPGVLLLGLGLAERVSLGLGLPVGLGERGGSPK
jgi:hypothetical protein